MPPSNAFWYGLPSERPRDAFDRDLRVPINVPPACECGVGRRHDHPVVARLCDRPLAGLHLTCKELVEAEPAARFHKIIADLVVRSCCKRRDARRGRGGIQELALGLDKLLDPGTKALIAVQLISGCLVDDVEEAEVRGS